MAYKVTKKTNKNYNDKLDQAILRGLNKANDFLEDKLKERTGIKDYTIAALREDDYPFSTRHGLNTAKSPDSWTNIQSGLLNRSIKKDKAKFKGTIAKARVYINASECPYISYLVKGTYKMRPRDIFQGVYDDHMKTAVKMVLDELKEV